MRLILGFISVLFFSVSSYAGELVVFLKDANSGVELTLLDTNTKKEKKLSIGDMQVIYPTITADGKLVAFSGSEDYQDWGIYIYDLSTNLVHEVVAPNGLTIQPTFSGNSSKLAYTAPVNNKNQIHILDYKKWLIDRNTKASVIKTASPAYYPYLSAAGFKVTFHLSYTEGDNKHQKIAMFDTQTDKLSILKDQHGKPLHGKAPCFSLDDSRIAFVSPVKGDRFAIKEFDIDAQKVKQLTSGEYKDYSPRYTTGARLLFSSNRSGRFKFYTIDLNHAQTGFAIPTVLHHAKVDIWDPRTSGSTQYRQVRKRDIGGDARSSFGAVTVGDSIYVVGGHRGFEHTYPPESFSREVYRYDSKTNSWTKLANKISPVHGVTVAHHKGYLYAFGGFAYSKVHKPKWKSLNSIERYDIAQNKWEVIGELPEPRSSNAIAVLGSKVYLIGGWNATPKFEGDKDGTFHKTVVVFDMETESASHARFNVPAKPRRAFTATTQDGNIIIGGGITQGGRHFDMLGEVWSINPSMATKWTRLADLPFANFAPAMMNLNGELFMFGGMKLTKDGYGYVNHVYKLSIGAKSWVHTGRFLDERKGFIQPVLFQGKAALLGGHTYDYVGRDGPVSTFELFY